MPTVSLIRTHSYHPQILETSLETLLEPMGGMTAFVKQAIGFYSNQIY